MALTLFAVDMVAMAQLQTEMVYRIAAAYGLTLTDSTRRGEVLAIVGLSIVGSGVLKTGASIVEIVPLVGAISGANDFDVEVHNFTLTIIGMTEYSFIFYAIAFFGIILIRYFLTAGVIYLYLYFPFHQYFENYNFEQLNLSWKTIKHDILLSILSAIIFALSSTFILLAYSLDITCLYSQPQTYGLWYLGLSFSAVLLLQDAYFYFTHRLFHHPLLFRWFHQGHHLSRNPTPWTSFAFDPLEAIVQSLFLLAIVFIIPLHFITLIAVLTTMTAWAVLNHIGLDHLPNSFPHHWLGKWFIGPAHHAIHHRKYAVHYGLYFTLLDKLLSTQDSDYEKVSPVI